MASSSPLDAIDAIDAIDAMVGGHGEREVLDSVLGLALIVVDELRHSTGRRKRSDGSGHGYCLDRCRDQNWTEMNARCLRITWARMTYMHDGEIGSLREYGKTTQ